MVALEGVDFLEIGTEEKEFRSPGFAAIKAALMNLVVIGGRDMFDPALPRTVGLKCPGIGRQ